MLAEATGGVDWYFNGLLNNRPRKILGFRTPAEVFADIKLGDVAGVALQA